MASRQSSAQTTILNGQSVEETGTVKWFSAEKARVVSLRMVVRRMCLSTSRLLRGLALRGSTKGNLWSSMWSRAGRVQRRRGFA